VGDAIMRMVAEILENESWDPRVEGVTISGVRMNSDLTVAEVLYTPSMLHGDDPEAVQAGLDKATGFVRSKLAARMHGKRVPQIRFVRDDFLEDMVYE
jgi:ribosome-binding factor A